MGEDASFGVYGALLVSVLVVELQEEKFFEFQACASSVEHRLALGIVYDSECLVVAEEFIVVDNRLGQVLLDGW